MNTREFLKTCLGGGVLTTAIPYFVTPKCPNCGATLVGSTCLYCKSPVIGVFPDDIVIFNTPEMEAPDGFDQYQAGLMLGHEITQTLDLLQAKFSSVTAIWMGHKTGFFRVEIRRNSHRSEPFSYYG